jgi:peptide/nickel transport system permease protein
MRNAPLLVGAGISLFFVALAALSLVWTPYDVAAIDIGARFLKPSFAHWLGTDQLGRDLLSLLMAGAGNALIVAVSSTLGALIAGVVLGLIAAAFGGWFDGIIMRVTDVIFAFPALVLAILIGAVLGAGLFNAALAIAIFNIPIFARLARSQALKIWPQPYVLAARLAGKGRLRISVEHILPQMRNVLLAQALIQMSFSVAAESGLSYVGLGAAPPSVSWGRMIYDAQTLIIEAPLLILVPCVAIILLVFGLNRLAQGLSEPNSNENEQ